MQPSSRLPVFFCFSANHALLLSDFLSRRGGLCHGPPLLVDGDVCLDVEVAVIHTEGPLAGLTTYRLYATLPGPADVVTTVFGDIEHPTALLTSTEWYQNENGGQFPCANNPLLFDLFRSSSTTAG